MTYNDPKSTGDHPVARLADDKLLSGAEVVCDRRVVRGLL